MMAVPVQIGITESGLWLIDFFLFGMMLDTGYWIQDAGYRIQDTGYRI